MASRDSLVAVGAEVLSRKALKGPAEIAGGSAHD